MAKNIGKLAQRYAKALLIAISNELGTEGKPTPAQGIAVALSGFAQAWQDEKEFSGSILNPMFKKGQRLKALLELAKHAGLSDVSQRFLVVVFERDRIAALPEIVAAFSKQADKAAGVVQVEVTVARDLEQNESQQIEQSLGEQIEGELEFSWNVDQALIGGMLVRYGGCVLDGSVSGRLDRIEKKLLGTAS